MLDLQALQQSDKLAEFHKSFKILSVNVPRATGIISFLSSAAIIWHILRSHKGLTTTYHRLVFGLSIADMMTSFCFILNTILTPTELQYLIPYSRGNIRTCSAQGFIIAVGYEMVCLYNCSICFYYLAIIAFNKKGVFIQNKLEPWFHGISIIWPNAIAIRLLTLNAFNYDDNLRICFQQPYNPPHCMGYKDGDILPGFLIPCGRGKVSLGYVIISHIVTIVMTPLVIIVTMTMMHKIVRDSERKMLHYGARTLRLRQSVLQNYHRDYSIVGTNNRNQAETATMVDKIKGILKCICFRNKNRRHHLAMFNSSTRTQEKRSILYMAMSYSLAWSLIFVPYLIRLLFKNEALYVLIPALSHLQGLFNLIVYMSPKVRNAKNSRRSKLTWFQAIGKAWTSKGLKRRSRILGGGVNVHDGKRCGSLLECIRSIFTLCKRKSVR